MSVGEDEEYQDEDVDLVAGPWRRVGEPRGGAREREPSWTGSRPWDDPTSDSRLELARSITTPQNRRAGPQPSHLRQLRLCWRRWRRRLDAAADDCAVAGATVGRSRPDRPGTPSFASGAGVRGPSGQPFWGFPPQTQGPGFVARASFPGIACITGFGLFRRVC